MSKVWVISDPHFGHSNVHKFRTVFSSPEENDQVILENICKTVGKKDTLWILGDCFFTTESYYMFFNVVVCNRIHWVLGNHDTDKGLRQENVKRFCRETHPKYGKIGSLFKYKNAWLSHHPIHPQELRGRKNIHGHTHFELMKLSNGHVDNRYINVCCGYTNYKPVNIQELL